MDLGLGIAAGVLEDDGGGGRGHVADLDVLILVTQGGVDEFEQPLAQVDGGAEVHLVVIGAHVVDAGAEDAGLEVQRLLAQVRLLEADDGLVGELPDLEADAELLAVADEDRAGIEEVEVGLGHLGEDVGPLERAVAGSEGHLARVALHDGNPQVLAAWDVRVLGLDVDIVEISGVLEPQLRDFHEDGVEDVAGPERQFAQDDGALGLGVALEDDRLDVEALALLDVVLDVDVAGRQVGLADRVDPGAVLDVVEVAIAAVEVLQVGDVLVELRGGEDLAGLLADDALQDRRGVDLVAGEGDVADPILAPLVDREGDDHPAGLRVVEDDLVLGDLDVEVAVVLVIVAELAQVVLELVVLEPAGFGQPGEDPPPPRVHFAAQLLALHPVVADEQDVGDPDLHALLDFEDDRAQARGAILVDPVADRHLVVADLLVIVPDLLRVLLHLALVERRVGLGLHLVPQALGLDALVAVINHRQDPVLRGHLDHQVESVGIGHFPLGLDELEKAGSVKVADVAVEDGVVQVAALVQLHVGPHHLLVHVGRAHEFNGDRTHLVAGSRHLRAGGHGLGAGGAQPPDGCQANDCQRNSDPAPEVTGYSFQSG